MRHVLALLALSMAFVAGCGDDGGDSAPTTSGGGSDAARAHDDSAATKTDTVEARAPEGAPSTARSGETFVASVRNGSVDGGPGRWKVDKGERVTIVVRSDVADEIHVHGYDETADIKAGSTGEVSFTANVDGAFEVELEKTHLLLGTLQVNP